MKHTAFSLFALLALAACLLETSAPPARAGTIDIDDNLNVASNLTAAAMTLSGQTITNWSGGAGSNSTIYLPLGGSWVYDRLGSISSSNNAAPIYLFSTTASNDVTGIGFWSTQAAMQSRYGATSLNGLDQLSDWGSSTGLLVAVYMSSTSSATNQSVLRFTSANQVVQWSTTVVATAANTVQYIAVLTNDLGAISNWLTTGPTNVSTLRVDFKTSKTATNAIVLPVVAIGKVVK